MASQPRTISQRIELIGAEQIAAALEKAGKAGAEAFKATSAELERLAAGIDKTVAVVRGFENAFSRLKNLGGQIGFGGQIPTLVQGVNDFERAIGRVIRNTGLLAAGVTAAGTGIVKFATGAIRSADELQDNAAAAGLSTDAYQRLQFAMNDAGVSQSQFQQGTSRLVKQFEDARNAQLDFAKALDPDVTAFRSAQDPSRIITKTDEEVKKLNKDVTDTKNLFTRMGIDVRNIGIEEAFLRVGDALRALPSATKQVEAGFETLGARVGPKFTQGLIGARQLIGEVADDFERIKLRPEQIEATNAADKALNKLSTTAEKARTRVGAVFAPSVEAGARAITETIARFLPGVEQFASSIQNNLKPIIEDLARVLRGEGAQTSFVQELQERFTAFGESVGRIVNGVIRPAFEALMAGLERVAQGINSVFGTQLTGTDVGIVTVLGRITGAFGLVESGAKLALSAVSTFFQGILAGAAVVGLLAAIAGWPATIAAAFVAAAIVITTNWEGVKTFFKGLGVDLEGVETRLREFASATGTNILGGLAENFRRGSEALADFQAKAEQLGGFWPQLGNVLRSLDPDLDRILTLIENGIDRLERLIERIKNFGGAGTAAAEARKTDVQRDAENAEVQADTTNEERRQRARLGTVRATTELTAAERTLTQATIAQDGATKAAVQTESLWSKALRAASEAITQNSQATQQASSQAVQTTQATKAARGELEQFNAKIGTVEISKPFAAGSKSIEEVQRRLELAQNVVSTFDLKAPTQGAAALGKEVRDLAQPFGQVRQTIRDLAQPFGQIGQNVRDLAQPIRTLGDEATKAGTGVGQLEQKAGRLPPKIIDIQQSLQGLQTTQFQELGKGAEQGTAGITRLQTAAGKLGPKVIDVQKALQGIPQATQGLPQVATDVQKVVDAIEKVGQASVAPGAIGPFDNLVQQAQTARDRIVAVFQGLLQTIEQAISGGAGAGLAVTPGTGGGLFGGLIEQARQAATQILEAFRQIGGQLGAALSGGGGVAGGPGIGATEGALAAGAGVGGGPFASLIEAARQASAQILEIFRQLGSQLGSAISGAGAVVAPGAIPAEGAPGATGGAFSSLVTQAQTAVQSVLQLFSGLGQQITQAILNGLQGLVPALQSVFSQIPTVFQSAVNAIETAIRDMLSTVQTASEEAIRKLEDVVRAAREAAGAVERVGQGRGFRPGGYTGAGPASRPAGTVHAGEYVQPKWVVRQPGVLAAMEWLRRTGDLQGMIERFSRGFDMGGLVPGFPEPRFAYAGGGAVSKAGTPINLFLPDGRRLATVMGDSIAVKEIKDEAVRSSYLSLGRKPSRYT